MLTNTAQRISASTLIVVNIGVALYALARQAGYAELLLLYFAETVIIGILNVPKLLIASVFTQTIYTVDELRTAGKRTVTVVLLLLVYAIVFSIIWMLLYVAIGVTPILLDQADRAAGLSTSGRRPWDEVAELGLPIALLAVSHGVSFVVNFLLGREFRGASLLRIAVQPVLRTAWIIGVMFVAGLVALALPAIAKSTVFAVVVVSAKIAADFYSHRRERMRFTGSPGLGT